MSEPSILFLLLRELLSILDPLPTTHSTGTGPHSIDGVEVIRFKFVSIITQSPSGKSGSLFKNITFNDLFNTGRILNLYMST